jgi:hypothetical protein
MEGIMPVSAYLFLPSLADKGLRGLEAKRADGLVVFEQLIHTAIGTHCLIRDLHKVSSLSVVKEHRRGQPTYTS